MPFCAVKLCHNYPSKLNTKSKISYHQFPTDPLLRHRWTAIIQRTRCDDCWKPTKSSIVCSEHFSSDSVYYTKNGPRRLKKEAVPSKEPVPEASEAEEVEPEENESEAAKEREARAQASIKERERQVQRALATSLRDRDKEREYHKRDEAVQHFNALLADLVRNPDLTWREAKKQLKKDHRYSLADELAKDDKERLFSQHTGTLSSKRRDKLRALLGELGVGCTAHWRDVRKLLAEQAAAPQYRSAPQMEREFRDYQRDKQSAAKTALRQLLLETRSITHRSMAAVRESPAAMTSIQDTLKHDARYTALDHIPEERQQIITAYLEELEKKGPPPPPTATEPSRRSKQ